MRPQFLFLILAAALLTSSAPAQTSNSWADLASGKWETAADWSLGVAPTNTQSGLITNAFTVTDGIGATAKTITIDSTTATSFFNTMTISNLTLSAPRVHTVGFQTAQG